MKVSLSAKSLTTVDADAIAIGVRKGKARRGDPLRGLERVDGALRRHIQQEGFRGERGDVLKVPLQGRARAKWVVLVGLGDQPSTASDARLVSVKAAWALREQRSLAILPPSEGAPAIRAATEGVISGCYRYTPYLTGKRSKGAPLQRALILVGQTDGEAKRALEEGRILGEAIQLARDLVNAAPNDLDPPRLAAIAVQQANAHDVTCEVWDKRQIADAGMHLLLAVNRGSAIEPRVVHLTYRPTQANGKVPRVVLVGKGVTFDSGGLCVKPADGMLTMKCDMAGAAVTLATVIAAARMKLPIEIHGIFGATENMTGSQAYRPGDVIPSLDGRTVEIVNTDAEGRLVLADLIAHARTLRPDYLIDYATLTGACLVALGPWTAGLFANDDDLAMRYVDAGRHAGEALWRMPLDADLAADLKSDIADLKHTGGRWGGAIAGALFIREFVGKSKWAHLDIAGPSFLDRAHGVQPKGGTGFGVLTSVNFLRDLALSTAPKAPSTDLGRL